MILFQHYIPSQVGGYVSSGAGEIHSVNIVDTVGNKR